MKQVRDVLNKIIK